ncbi:MAG: anhydro-N-acetylmuramic acid kinase [Bacteroidetes bacterium]|nr:anhydro-N-acetylmuramic acid kinase [Bacteroidota bacterium]
METYRAIGLMSGSSLDGLDVAYCHFTHDKNRWSFRILHTEVVPYSEAWILRLRSLPRATARELSESHAALGRYFGEAVKAFVAQHGLHNQVDLVASHGHTLFHFPDKHFTTQIGDGAAIAQCSGLPVVCDLRTADIAAGGQGTPIVPIGDWKLFGEYEYCLNIGGIANISCHTGRGRVAFDICCANQVLNRLAATLGHEYDEGGKIAASGQLQAELLNQLNALEYYQRAYPKSLDNSYSSEVISPILDSFPLPAEDQLRSFTEHIALQVAAHIRMMAYIEKQPVSPSARLLCTGGGAFNHYLMERIQSLSGVQVHVPDEQTVKFKEALVMALMGVLRLRGEENVLCSVTGAAHNTVGGAIYHP